MRQPEILKEASSLLIYRQGNWGPLSLTGLAKITYSVTNSERNFTESQKVLILFIEVLKYL